MAEDTAMHVTWNTLHLYSPTPGMGSFVITPLGVVVHGAEELDRWYRLLDAAKEPLYERGGKSSAWGRTREAMIELLTDAAPAPQAHLVALSLRGTGEVGIVHLPLDGEIPDDMSPTTSYPFTLSVGTLEPAPFNVYVADMDEVVRYKVLILAQAWQAQTSVVISYQKDEEEPHERRVLPKGFTVPALGSAFPCLVADDVDKGETGKKWCLDRIVDLPEVFQERCPVCGELVRALSNGDQIHIFGHTHPIGRACTGAGRVFTRDEVEAAAAERAKSPAPWQSDADDDIPF